MRKLEDINKDYKSLCEVYGHNEIEIAKLKETQSKIMAQVAQLYKELNELNKEKEEKNEENK